MAAFRSFLSPNFAWAVAQYSASFKHPLSCKPANAYTLEFAPPPTLPVSNAFDPSRASRYGAFSRSDGIAAPVRSNKSSMDFDTPIAQYLTRNTVTKHSSNWRLSSAPPPMNGIALAPLGDTVATKSIDLDKFCMKRRLSQGLEEVTATCTEKSSEGQLHVLSSLAAAADGTVPRTTRDLRRNFGCENASAQSHREQKDRRTRRKSCKYRGISAQYTPTPDADAVSCKRNGERGTPVSADFSGCFDCLAPHALAMPGLLAWRLRHTTQPHIASSQISSPNKASKRAGNHKSVRPAIGYYVVAPRR